MAHVVNRSLQGTQFKFPFTFSFYLKLVHFCQARIAKKKRPSLMQMMHLQQGRQSPRSKAGAKWLSKIKKGQVAPKGSHVCFFLLETYFFFVVVFIIEKNIFP